MFILGLTGGIGSGKSKVLYFMEHEYNAYICETDKLAHELMKPHTVIYNRIIEVFGNEIIYKDGNIDRKKLGEIVFSDDKKLEILNNIVHPGVKEYIINDIKCKQGMYSIYIIESALLLQDGYDEICNEIWMVKASIEVRIDRLMKYRGYTKEKCLSVIANQPEDSYYECSCDFIINNDFDYENTANQLKVRLNNGCYNDIII